jgi:periplasmic copper chaperone A
MLISNTLGAMAATLAAYSMGDACAHPGREQQEATIGAQYKAVVRVPHGCEGTSTVWVRVHVPTAGQSSRDLKFPAPAVRVIQAQAPGQDRGKEHASGPRTYKAGPLVIEAPWSRATPGGARVAVGFLKISNTGKEADRLIGGTIEVAKKLEIHEMTMTDNVMRMRQLPKGLEIKPGETVELKPSGYHLMFMELARPLKVDDVVKGVLRFERAGEIAVEYRVAPLGAQPGGHKH